MKKILVWLKKEWILILILLVLAVITRFWGLGYPDRIVFDELYFAKFVSHYFLHSYYFDIHPPLANLIMAGVAKISGINPVLTFNYSAINDTYPDSFYLLLRGIVSFFGTLLPLGVYALSRSLRFSVKVSFLAGILVILDNAFLVQSRFILTDAFLLAFGTFGLAGIVFAIRGPVVRYWLLVIGSFLVGASYSIKWTGLLFFGMSIAYACARMIREKKFATHFLSIGIILCASFLVYVGAMAIHIGQLNKTGPGDAFMSLPYRSTLLGNTEFNSPEFANNRPGFVQKFIELNTRMYSANAGITATHPYGSKWYTWPLMQRSVYYWYNKIDDNHEGRIYLLGNPLVWLAGILVMIFLSVWMLYCIVRRRGIWFAEPGILFILTAFFANLFAYIPISRVAFLYHYLPSLVFLVIGLAYILGKIKKWWIVAAIIAIIGIAFLWLSPISYGYPLTSDQFQSRMLLKSWE